MEKSLIEDSNPALKDELIKIRQEKKEKDIKDYINPEIGQQNYKKGIQHKKEGR